MGQPRQHLHNGVQVYIPDEDIGEAYLTRDGQTYKLHWAPSEEGEDYSVADFEVDLEGFSNRWALLTEKIRDTKRLREDVVPPLARRLHNAKARLEDLTTNYKASLQNAQGAELSSISGAFARSFREQEDEIRVATADLEGLTKVWDQNVKNVEAALAHHLSHAETAELPELPPSEEE